MIGPVERIAYALGQTVRVSWFFGQSALAARINRPAAGRADPGPVRPPRAAGSGASDRRAVLEELRRLIRRDLANIEAGYYRMPHNLLPDPRRALDDAWRFFQDLPEVGRRREARLGGEVRRAPPPGAGRLPAYYLQNFHFQTDGYLSDRSARLYDHQVEVLFGGGADAMRRHALVPLWHFLRENGVAGRRLLDVASGTGSFLTFVKDNYPRLETVALDLSAYYLAEARRRLAPWRDARFVQAAAEAMPLPDGSVDAATCIYLFHELPPRVRAAVAAEIARVLKPGGILVLADSIQTGDNPAFDGLLDMFPAAFHEPYYADYLRRDLTEPFVAAGLRPAGTDLAFMTKLLVFRKEGRKEGWKEGRKAG
jgi:ubiquinone/menaquinone biosynthesis C-methylase UbiE